MLTTVTQETIKNEKLMIEWRPGVQPGLFQYPQGAAGKKAFKDKYAGHSDWRLPTIQEALSLVDYERTLPACNRDIAFGRTACVWTSTPAFPAASGRLWVIDFRDGSTFTQDRTFAAEVLLVRDMRAVDVPNAARR